MTPSDLSTLKQMSFADRWKKYTPMLMGGAINKQQYDYIFSLPYEQRSNYAPNAKNQQTDLFTSARDSKATEQVQEVTETILDAFGGKVVE